MHVDEVFDFQSAVQINDNHWVIKNILVPHNWSQGRTVFGGLSAGILCKALAALLSEDQLLRVFNTQFIGPLLPDNSFDIEIEKLRQGKNVTHYQARIVQNNKTCVSSQACYGVARSSSIKINNTQPHSMPEPKKAKFIPHIPKITPNYLRHIEYSIVEGNSPFTNSKKDFYHGWMRFKKPSVEVLDAHILTLIDSWPPTFMQQLRWPAPVSTITWNVEFIHPHRTLNGNEWLAYQVRTIQAAAGYGHTEAIIWDKHNEVIAVSRQTIAVFD